MNRYEPAARVIRDGLGLDDVEVAVGPTGLVSLDSTNRSNLMAAVCILVNGGCRFQDGTTEADQDGRYWATIALPGH